MPTCIHVFPNSQHSHLLYVYLTLFAQIAHIYFVEVNPNLPTLQTFVFTQRFLYLRCQIVSIFAKNWPALTKYLPTCPNLPIQNVFGKIPYF
jgi:hypothetical protein